MEVNLIAPCGMNCGVCLAYLRDKKKCCGCNGSDINKSVSCLKCIIKNCERRKDKNSNFCYECDVFPCYRMKQLDKRYRTKYNTSLIGNLEQIKKLGMDEFLKNEKNRWTCKSCNGIICIHRGYCLDCSK